MSLHGPILVPLDGSDLAERAVSVAAALARRAAAELLLVHVHMPISANPIHVEGLPVIDEQMRSLRRDHEQAYLAGASQRLSGVGASTALLDGPVAVALSEHAERSGARLIVMTTHGRGGFDRAWLGSVADELARISPVPLLLVRPEPGQAPDPLRRILVPLDGSLLAEAILEPAVWLARLEPDAELVLLRVVPSAVAATWVPDPALAASIAAQELAGREQDAREYLEDVLRRLGASGLPVRTRLEVAVSVPAAILEVAREERAEVVALATHGRSGVVRMALGSVADKVVRASRLPILLFRPKGSKP